MPVTKPKVGGNAKHEVAKAEKAEAAQAKTQDAAQAETHAAEHWLVAIVLRGNPATPASASKSAAFHSPA